MSLQCASCGGPLSAPARPVPSGDRRRDLILITIDDLAASLLFHDRREDGDLPSGSIEAAVLAGEISVDDMTRKFRESLLAGLTGS